MSSSTSCTNYNSGLKDTASPEYSYVVRKLRSFFEQEGFREVNTQRGRAILAACEDPKNMSTYAFSGYNWPLPQTGQMWLEEILLKNPDDPANGLFTLTTSYRNEPDPNPKRHDLTFPLFEFEMRIPDGHDRMEYLANFIKRLLRYLGYVPPKGMDDFPEGDYLDVVKEFGGSYGFELEHEHEEQLTERYGPIYFLKNFPEYTDPFWNMNRSPDDPKIAEKIDVICSDMETFGLAVRSCDKEMMRHIFNTISDGAYRKLLYSSFSKDRTEKELEEYLALNFFQRCGGGIGMTRLLKSMRREGLIPGQQQQN